VDQSAPVHGDVIVRVDGLGARVAWPCRAEPGHQRPPAGHRLGAIAKAHDLKVGPLVSDVQKSAKAVETSAKLSEKAQDKTAKAADKTADRAAKASGKAEGSGVAGGTGGADKGADKAAVATRVEITVGTRVVANVDTPRLLACSLMDDARPHVCPACRLPAPGGAVVFRGDD
jgi:hypothetical protein